MGEYEDRYPEAYGRGEEAAQPAAEPEHPPQPRQVRDVPGPIPVPSEAQPQARQLRERAPLFRSRLGLGAAAETAPSWRHGPASAPPGIVEPTAPPISAEGSHRGRGPRGYVRSPQRIHEDICDRLTENPFIDASDIEVSTNGAEVTLAGAVDSLIALRQAEAIAWEVVGVGHVHNDLQVRAAGARGGPSPGDQVNRALGTGRPVDR
jgi:hypothetical protein